VTLKQAGVLCVVLVSSTATAVISSTVLLYKKTKIKTQLIILTLDRFGRFGIEITGHYVFTGWIPKQQHQQRLRTRVALLRKLTQTFKFREEFVPGHT